MSYFHTLTAIRRERSEERKAWATYRVCKNGQLAKKPTTTHMTRLEAEEKAAYLTMVNPGSLFEAVAK